MSDPAKTSSEGKEKEIDLTKYVPKEEHEKVANTVKDLEAKLEEARLSLLDPRVIEALSTKKVEKKVEKAIESISDDDIEKLSSKDLITLAIEKAKEAILPEVAEAYDEQLKKMGNTLSDVLAVLELQEVEKRYKDFEDFRDDTRKILETSTTPLTIEQAYKLAKANKSEKADETDAEKDKKARSSTEKPSGTIARDTVVKKDFKDKNEAALDAWDQVVGAGKDTL